MDKFKVPSTDVGRELELARVYLGIIERVGRNPTKVNKVIPFRRFKGIT